MKNLSLLVAGLFASHCAAVPVSVGFENAAVDAQERELVIESIFDHLRAFEEIAAADAKGSRSVVNGYEASAEYVMSRLKKTGLKVEKDYFEVPIHEEVEMPNLSFPNASPDLQLTVCNMFTGWQHYETGCDYSTMRYGGDGKHDITSEWIDVGYGCDTEDYPDEIVGKIALIDGGGSCSYYEKGLAAQAAGAAAALMYGSEGSTNFPTSRVRATDWTHDDELVTIPCVGLTRSVALGLMQSDATKVVRMQTNTKLYLYETFNIIAETGTAEDTIMIGAHLDSVPEGPGVNDDGSGSAVVLEIALRVADMLQDLGTLNVRFGWWGAEEIGLLGSYHYVRERVADGTIRNIQGYYNYDMLGSPNFVRYVHNSDDAQDAAKSGSHVMQALLEDTFDRIDVPHKLTGMTGGSDFLPFLKEGVPTNGLLTGASGKKSDADRAVYGGFANTQLDPCYHAPCDTVDNISREAIYTDYLAATESLIQIGLGKVAIPQE